jgi:hypothetical protein
MRLPTQAGGLRQGLQCLRVRSVVHVADDQKRRVGTSSASTIAVIVAPEAPVHIGVYVGLVTVPCRGPSSAPPIPFLAGPRAR